MERDPGVGAVKGRGIAATGSSAWSVDVRRIQEVMACDAEELDQPFMGAYRFIQFS